MTTRRITHYFTHKSPISSLSASAASSVVPPLGYAGLGANHLSFHGGLGPSAQRPLSTLVNTHVNSPPVGTGIPQGGACSSIASLDKFGAFVPKIMSYNVGGLSQYTAFRQGCSRRLSISGALSDFIHQADIICLQETDLAAGDQSALSYLRGCKISRNNLKMGVAGTLVIDTPSILRWYRGEEVALPPCCKGYVQCRRYTPLSDKGHLPFLLFNCYLYTGVGKDGVQAKLLAAMASVSGGLDTVITGDFNFIRRREDSSSEDPGLAPPHVLDAFDDLCAHFGVMEVGHDEHTYFHYTEDVRSKWSHSSRLDRFYIPARFSISPFFTPAIAHVPHSTNYTPPSASRPRRHFSDHIPICLSFGMKAESGVKSKSIPKWLASSERFTEKLGQLWRNPSKISQPYVYLGKFKKAMYRAATLVRKDKIDGSSFLLKYSHLFCLLRLIIPVSQDVPRIRRLLLYEATLSDLVEFKGGRFIDAGLEAAFNELRYRASGRSDPPVRPNPISAIKEKLPSSRIGLLHLRAKADDAPCFDPQGKARIAADYWKKVWAKRTSGPDKGAYATYLDDYKKKVDLSLLAVPSLSELKDVLLKTGNTAAGPDGIPFAAWRSLPDFSAPLLHAALVSLMGGQPPPLGFNQGLLFLLPKKSTGLVEDTRPLSVTNTENRVLASVVAQAIMPAVLKLIDPCQKGFLWGRSGADHTVDINSWFFDGVKKNDSRLLFLLDTAKAFDSIDHAWISTVLEKVGFPAWVRFFVRGSLSNVSVSPFFGVRADVWISILRGVKQGDPLSPLLFIISFDPLLSRLGLIPLLSCYAFADDLALAVLLFIHVIPALLEIDNFAAISGLGINKDKSCVVSAGGGSSVATLCDQIKRGPWPVLPLRDSAVHLGIPVGRMVTLGDIFIKPFEKATQRIQRCKESVLALSIPTRILFVNVFIISLFSYHCLFFVMPKEYLEGIRNLIRKLVIPFNGGAYTYDSLVCWSKLFSIKPSLKDPWAYNAALLASRSPLMQANVNYWKLPDLDVVYSKSIIDHRNAAAVDFWRGKHSDDGTLARISDFSSPAIYNSLIEDEYLVSTSQHIGEKVRSFILKKSSTTAPDLEDCISILAHNMAVAKRVPRSLLVFHFTLINNAVATARRKRHQDDSKIADVAKCSFCDLEGESTDHWIERCAVVRKARSQFLARKGIKGLRDDIPGAFLVDRKHSFSSITAILSFNFAVWKHKEAARSTKGERDAKYQIGCLEEIASSLFSSCANTSVPKKHYNSFDQGDSHNTLLNELDKDVVVYYTDGSASPNPGPAGAGVAIFDLQNDRAIDVGLSLGYGTNNLGELVALCLAFLHVCRMRKGRNVAIFSDSMLAIQAATKKIKKRRPKHETLVRLLQCLYAQAASAARTLTIQWVKGHCRIGGNERADSVAKAAARHSTVGSNDTILDLAFFSTAINKERAWPYGSLDVSDEFFAMTPFCYGSPIRLSSAGLLDRDISNSDLDFKHGDG